MKRDPSLSVLSVRIFCDPEKNIGPIFMEHIYAALHGLPKKTRVSFEIVYRNGILSFLVVLPTVHRFLVENQIYAQYPTAEITVTDDPLLLLHAPFISTELRFLAPDLYPIKRYQQFEDQLSRQSVDPLAGITEALSSCVDGSGSAGVHIVVQPLDDHWRFVYRHCLEILHKSKNFFLHLVSFRHFYTRLFCIRSRSVRFFFWPLYMWFWSAGMLVGTDSSLHHTDVKRDRFLEEVTTVHERETALGAAADKISKLAFVTTIRLFCTASTVVLARQKLHAMVAAFHQFNIPHINGFYPEKFSFYRSLPSLFIRRFLGKTLVLNIEELATLYHFPTPMVQTPTIDWVRSRQLAPPPSLPFPNVLLGHTHFRSSSASFGVLTEDRRRHTYIVGKTGMGKSTLLENMIFSDIQRGHGVGVIDPHGDLAEKILRIVPSYRTNDIILFDPSDRAFPVAFNIMESADPSMHTMIASGIVGIFKKIYGDSWGPRLEHILRNTLLALLSYKQMTLLGIVRMLQDGDFRLRVIAAITDPIVRNFWIHEFERMDARSRTEAVAPILNKVGQFLASPIIRNIVGQPQSRMHLRFAMDHQKIVIINLAKGKIGEDQSALLGALLITQFQLDAMARASVPLHERKDFFLYVDEFQNFATDSFATILSEARKYHLSLIMAHQYVLQMTDVVRDAVFGNVGSMIAFQVGYDDAELLSAQFAAEVLPQDLVSLEKYHFYIRLLLHGMPTKTFSATTLPPVPCQEDVFRLQKILRFVRERYATPVQHVEEKIQRWSQNIRH